MHTKLLRAFFLLFFLVACQPSPIHEDVAPQTPDIILTTPPPAPTETTAAPATPAEPTALPSHTPQPTLDISPTPEATLTATPAAPIAPTQPGQIYITHTDVEKFHQIPDDYIAAASNMTILFRHASIGANILDGLRCLMNDFSARPNFCDRELTADQVFYDAKYNYTNWTFEFHQPPPEQNPGWWNKINLFIERINGLAPDERYQVAAVKLGYVDGHAGSNIVEVFFAEEPAANWPNLADLEALEAAYPDTTFVWWTIALARLDLPLTQQFNQQLRDYAAATGKPFMDIADIQSHRPDGSSCFDAAGQGVEAICPEYTNEARAGHLNAVGRQRVAMAFWVMMAKLAGWDG